MYWSSSEGAFASSGSARTRRSARRHTVRATWAYDAAWVPPGSMNERCSGSPSVSASIICSKRSTSGASILQLSGSWNDVVSVARQPPMLNSFYCIHRMFSALSAFLSITDSISPMNELSSSMVPYASRRGRTGYV